MPQIVTAHLPRYCLELEVKPPSRLWIRDLLAVVCICLLTAGVASAYLRAEAGSAIQTANAPAVVDDLTIPDARESVASAPLPPAAKPTPIRRQAASPAAELRTQILAALGSSTAQTIGASVEIDGLGRVVDRNGSTPLLPASTLKLYTASAAFSKLGANMVYETKVLRVGDVGLDGTLNGKLVLVGGGDPFFMKGNLDELAAGVAQSGIKKIEGELYGDDTRYDRTRGAPGWKPTYIPNEIGPLSALAVDLNEWTKEPGYVAEPALGNLELFRASLAAHGIVVTGPSKLGDASGGKEVASHSSAPLTQILDRMLKESDNFSAELILKELGASSGKPTTAGGIDVVSGYADEIGAGRPRAVDGSGLSLENRVAPNQQVDLLRKLEGTPTGEFIENSLPVTCGGPGTYWMNRRLCGTPAAGRVASKTGFLRGVRSLAGYTRTASGRKVWFSFILLESTNSTQAWTALDQTLVTITSFGS